jgi:uncharacterized protein YebE (UPF0316 family)
MLMDINWLLWLGLFGVSLLIDAVYVLYTVSIMNARPMTASIMSVLSYVLGAIGVVSYVDNKLNLVPLVFGAFIGTFVVVKWESNKKNRKKIDNLP